MDNRPDVSWQNKQSFWAKYRLILLIVGIGILAIGIGYFSVKFLTRDKTQTKNTTATTDPANDIPLDQSDGSAPVVTPTPSSTLTPDAQVTVTTKADPAPAPTTTVASTITGSETADSDVDGKVDSLKITFSGAMDTTIVSTGGIKVSGFTIDKLNWTNSTTLNIILKESGAYDTDTTPTLTYTASIGKLKSASGIVLADTTIKAKDNANPIAVSAAAVDTNSTAGIQAGDKVVITFSEPVKTNPNIVASNINQILPLNNGHSWKDGAEAIGSVSVSLDNKTITVVLAATSSAPSIAVLDSIRVGSGTDSIGDLASNLVNNTTNKVQLNGSF